MYLITENKTYLIQSNITRERTIRSRQNIDSKKNLLNNGMPMQSSEIVPILYFEYKIATRLNFS